MTENLAERRCKPCEGGVLPLDAVTAAGYLDALAPDWQIVGTTLTRTFGFPAYSRTLAFANAVAWVAISEGHHPELVVNYSSCEVRWTTFAIGGLSENDFICAAKTDRLLDPGT